MPVFKRIKPTGPAGPAYNSGTLNTGDASDFVPSLADADAQYAALLKKKTELNSKLSEAVRSRRDAETILAAHEGSAVRAGVAELLGDESAGSRSAKVDAVRAARSLVSDIEDAIRICEQRLRDQRGEASAKACAKVRPEFTKRVKALATSLQVADEAHRSLDDMFIALEADDISVGSLGQVRPYFLGGAREEQRRIASYLKEVKEAGYVD